METTTLKSVPLQATHEALGAKMVPFAGYLMPLKYSSVTEEHKAVRNGVGLFDVSHMGEFFLYGPKALALIQRVTSNDAAKLRIGEAQYSCLPNDKGGIIDDLLVYRTGEEEYLLVVNASNIEKDWNWIRQHNTEGVWMEDISENASLLALQGPLAQQVLQKITSFDLSTIPYYKSAICSVGNIPQVLVSATGYTGAGGYELYVPNKEAVALWNIILEAGQAENIQPVGLGARDTLRLEMGYCLYGNDIDDTTSPLEAGLGWVTKFTKSFVHSDSLLAQKKAGITKKLVGFEMVERGIPRQGYDILDSNGTPIGKVTSGGQSPMLEKGIGLGYVQKSFAKKDTELLIQIRKKQVKGKVVKLPFFRR